MNMGVATVMAATEGVTDTANTEKVMEATESTVSAVLFLSLLLCLTHSKESHTRCKYLNTVLKLLVKQRKVVVARRCSQDKTGL